MKKTTRRIWRKRDAFMLAGFAIFLIYLFVWVAALWLVHTPITIAGLEQTALNALVAVISFWVYALGFHLHKRSANNLSSTNIQAAL